MKDVGKLQLLRRERGGNGVEKLEPQMNPGVLTPSSKSVELTEVPQAAKMAVTSVLVLLGQG